MGSFIAELMDTLKDLIMNPASFKGRMGEKQVGRLLQTPGR
ncbi:hypothetical protein [Neobacillus piezotolerans]|nr:hypothetical protein [Neobacillus piezotolerans]